MYFMRSPFADIERLYPELNEHNWPDMVLEDIIAAPCLKEYCRDYIRRHKDQLGLKWAKAFLTFLIHVGQDDAEQVVETYRAHLKSYPPNAFVLLHLGHYALYEYGDLFEARRCLKQAQQEISEHPKISNDLGLISMLLGDWQVALEHYERAETLADEETPELSIRYKTQALFNQAVIRANYLHAYEDAIKLLEKALKLRPDYRMAQNLLEEFRKRVQL